MDYASYIVARTYTEKVGPIGEKKKKKKKGKGRRKKKRKIYKMREGEMIELF